MIFIFHLNGCFVYNNHKKTPDVETPGETKTPHENIISVG